jgi:predicted RNA-binding protein
VLSEVKAAKSIAMMEEVIYLKVVEEHIIMANSTENNT